MLRCRGACTEGHVPKDMYRRTCTEGDVPGEGDLWAPDWPLLRQTVRGGWWVRRVGRQYNREELRRSRKAKSFWGGDCGWTDRRGCPAWPTKSRPTALEVCRTFQRERYEWSRGRWWPAKRNSRGPLVVDLQRRRRDTSSPSPISHHSHVS